MASAWYLTTESIPKRLHPPLLPKTGVRCISPKGGTSFVSCRKILDSGWPAQTVLYCIQRSGSARQSLPCGLYNIRRSRAQCRPPELDHLSRHKVPRGFVDVCLCIKITPSKKRTLLAYLHRREQEQENLGLRGIGTCLPPDSGPWWHQCRAVDGTGVLETKLHPYLLMSDDLLCGECFKSRQCRYCSTRVIWVSEPNEMDSSHLSVLSTERVLSDQFWMHQVAFPFPRRTKVLYPRSSYRAPANDFGSSFAWYNRWYFRVRFLLVNSWHQ